MMLMRTSAALVAVLSVSDVALRAGAQDPDNIPDIPEVVTDMDPDTLATGTMPTVPAITEDTTTTTSSPGGPLVTDPNPNPIVTLPTTELPGIVTTTTTTTTEVTPPPTTPTTTTMTTTTTTTEYTPPPTTPTTTTMTTTTTTGEPVTTVYPTPPPPGTCHTCHESWGDDASHPCNWYPGQLFPHCDSGGYIQCGPYGGCVERPCAPGTVFNEMYQTCVHDCVLPEEYEGEEPLCMNPCTEENREMGQFHFDLCTDPSKYIQCDAFGGCFIRHCPTPLIWDSSVNNPEVEPWGDEPAWGAETGACNWADPTTCPLPTVCQPSECYTEEGEEAPTDYTTKFGVCNDDSKFYVCNPYGGCDVSKCPGWGMVFDEEVQDCVESEVCDTDCATNPCDGIDLGAGDHPYQPHCDDDKYVECNSVQGCRVLYCDYDKVWDDDAKACVIPQDIEELPTSLECSEQCDNPCGVQEDIDAENFHFEYCLSDSTFSQCDEFGVCFAMDCPPGMYWDDGMKTCGMM